MASELGYVILGADFNAKVAAADDTLMSDRPVLEASGLPVQRGCSHDATNLHGRLLIDFCLSTSLLMGTGRLRGGDTATATFSRRSSDSSRLNHLIMDTNTVARVSKSSVDTRRLDSDHKPLTLSALPPSSCSHISSSGWTCLPNIHPALGWFQTRPMCHAVDRPNSRLG